MLKDCIFSLENTIAYAHTNRCDGSVIGIGLLEEILKHLKEKHRVDSIVTSAIEKDDKHMDVV